MRILRIISPVILFAFCISCSKDDKPDTPGAISGQWIIHYYWDEKEETADFAGYVFEFLSNGQVKAVKAGNTVTGTWQETSNKFILDFGNDPVLEEINDDWAKVEHTTNFIHLEDDNPAQDDQLHFQKL